MKETGEFARVHKKEALELDREREKLEKALIGIKMMESLPSAVFIIDPRKEKIAVAEAQRLGIPIVAIVDTNCDPSGIDYPIPGNDDAIRAVRLITSRMADAILEGRGTLAKDESEGAETDAFQELVKDLAMQVAAANPAYVAREDVPGEVLEKEREIYRSQMADQKKPPQVIDKIVEGKLEKYFSEQCLLEQPFIKDASGKTKIKDLVDKVNAATKEKVGVRRFARFQVGGGG